MSRTKELLDFIRFIDAELACAKPESMSVREWFKHRNISHEQRDALINEYELIPGEKPPVPGHGG